MVMPRRGKSRNHPNIFPIDVARLNVGGFGPPANVWGSIGRTGPWIRFSRFYRKGRVLAAERSYHPKDTLVIVACSLGMHRILQFRALEYSAPHGHVINKISPCGLVYPIVINLSAWNVYPRFGNYPHVVVCWFLPLLGSSQTVN